MTSELAPIVLFAFNRPEHTRITLEHLARARLAAQSKLFIVCDGPKPDASEATRARIAEVHRVAASQPWAGEVTIRRNETNLGLARNVFDGVTQVVEEFGRVIVLEDDLKIGAGFLEYMNAALDRFADEPRVKQVSGFRFPFARRDSGSAFFLPVTNTIGWGTWKRAWDEVDPTAAGYEALRRDRALLRRFNLDGAYDYGRILLGQLERQQNDSWGILLWWSIFKNDGLVLYPDYTLIQHNDFDQSGVHRSDFSHYDMPGWSDAFRAVALPRDVSVDERAFRSMKAYIKRHTRRSPRKIARKVAQRILRGLRRR